MNIKTELLKAYICNFICHNIDDFNIDADKICDSVAIHALAEIQSILNDDKNSDFEAIEKIVCVFEKYKLDFGCRHDF